MHVTTGAEPQTASEARTDHSAWLVAGFALVMFGVHVITVLITPYSFHRDELLYIAMGKYLRPLAMDFPPFIAIAANTARTLFGDSLFAIRILPAVAGAALIVLAALIARELGGGRRAQALAMLCVLCAPLFMRSAALFQPVVFDQLWWTLALYGTLRIANRGAPRDWVLLGVAGGIGLLTKFSIGFIAVGIVAGLLLSPQRRAFASLPRTVTARGSPRGSCGVSCRTASYQYENSICCLRSAKASKPRKALRVATTWRPA